MHEMSIAQSLLKTARQKAAAEKAAGVKKVFVSLGRFSGVEPQLLKDAFDLLTRAPGNCSPPLETPPDAIEQGGLSRNTAFLQAPEKNTLNEDFFPDFYDAVLEISIEPFVIHCKNCNQNHQREEIDLICPGCGGALTEVVSGQEILLTGLEITSS